MNYSELSRDQFPGGLRDWSYKNRNLWYVGDPDLLRCPCVSVIGTRDISPAGAQRTKRLVAILVNQGYCIVSGLAEGVDSIAHSTALDLGGKTIAVMGTPIDKCYPAENKTLKSRIEEKGLVLSQFEIGSSVNKGNFPKRNILMAALSEGTIVVEAGEKSGTRYQVEAALKMKRKVGFLKSLADLQYSWISEALVDKNCFVITSPEDLSFLSEKTSNSAYEAVPYAVEFSNLPRP